MTSQRQKYYVCNVNTSTDKSTFKNFIIFLLWRMIWGFTLRYRRYLTGRGLFSLLKVFLETEMTKSPPIIVIECIFKN